MNRSAIAIALSLLAGIAAAAIVIMARSPAPAPPAAVEDYFDPSAGTEERIKALEMAVAEERNARQLLEEEIQILYSEIEALGEAEATPDDRDERRALAAGNRARLRAQQEARAGGATDSRIERMVAAGISAERADWILRRESELQMQAMQARFEARVAGEPVDPFTARTNLSAELRAEIGDTEYEQYLQANGRPTSVYVGNVYESSPAQQAGLLPGDQILNYNGSRIFDAGDLNRQTMNGAPGESVVVDVVRDGVQMQVVLPRGPLGVTVGRGPGRR